MNAVEFVTNIKIWCTDPPSHDPTRYWGDMMASIQRFNGPVLAKAAVHFRENWKHRYPPTIGEVMEVCRTTPAPNGHAGEMPWERKRREEAEPVEMSPERRAANLKKLHDLLAELRASSDMANAKKVHWLDTPMPENPLEGVTLSNALRRTFREKTDG